MVPRWRSAQGDVGYADECGDDAGTCCLRTRQWAMHLIHRFFRKVERRRPIDEQTVYKLLGWQGTAHGEANALFASAMAAIWLMATKQ